MKKILFFIFVCFFVFSFSYGEKNKTPQKAKLNENLYEATKTVDLGNNQKAIEIDDTFFPSSKENTGILDIPLASGINSFAIIINGFADVVVDLCVLFCFLCIILHCFKLWFSTTEIKKVFVDIIYKCLICIIVLLTFRPLTNTIVTFATSLGGTCSGATERINHIYGMAYRTLLTAVEKGLDDIKSTILNNAESIDGEQYISKDMVTDLMSYGMTMEECAEWMKQNGLNFAMEKRDAWGNKVWTNNKGEKLEKQNLSSFFWSSSVNFDKKDKKLKKEFNEALQLQYVKKINALTEVLSGENMDITEEGDKYVKMGGKKINVKERSFQVLKNTFFAPYLKNSKGENTLFISPSKILKTITIMSDTVSIAATDVFNKETGDVESLELNPKGVWTFKGVLKLLEALLYKLAMWLACIIVMVEYTITILEFYLVRGIACLLIPFFFIDATKSYAENIIKILLTYFFKILITVFICYFALGLFLDVVTQTVATADTNSSLTLITYLFTIFIGVMFCGKVPEILSVVMSGNPNMGFGTILQSARGAIHTASHLGGGAAKVVKGASNAVKGAVGMGMGAISAISGARRAFDTTTKGLEELNSVYKDKGAAGFSQKQIEGKALGAAFKTMGSAGLQSMGDSLYKAFTGQDKKRSESDGKTLSFGQSFENQKGHQEKADFGDMQRLAGAKAVGVGNDTVAKLKKQYDKHLPPDDQDAFTPKKK